MSSPPAHHLPCALRSYKRAPFFILDEIDANLDKFNVEKVVNYVRQRARISNSDQHDSVQCLVISLRVRGRVWQGCGT